MANPEHLAILKQGVEVWNRWRKENSGIVPNLRGANLGGADLRETDLSEANLLETNLSGTRLIEADLRGADLRGANLRGANLGGAKLGGARLIEADLHAAYLHEAVLIKADLSGADLSFADLREADLSGARLIAANLLQAGLIGVNLMNAICGATIFANDDLSETKNLDSITHGGPSTIGIDTLYNSKGNMPEAFLKGCGVLDQMIEYAKSLTGSPIEYYSCFISYSHNDEEFAKRLWEGLQAKNVRCWLACEDMKIGDKIRPTIEESIRLHDKLLLILSEHSMKSKWVKHEVENALDLEIEREKIVLFPVRVDDAIMDSEAGWANEIKKTRHIGDFTRWKDHDAYSKAFERLLRDLKAG